MNSLTRHHNPVRARIVRDGPAPSALRDDPDKAAADTLIGPFLNILALRTDVSGPRSAHTVR
ncbi:hypothetical protein OG762_36135 [Streptomyces sp. NBC_01136]|uniref:hypothetical protein n=1 Tax=unclassified Streptomyces TaxID=2593676 RepID=UPI003254BA7E|nr:hypothetical protein OG762_36135 [Streptomyces sp. NBC_01136]